MDASVYSEAKGEYTKQLTLFIVPTFHRFFMECLQQASAEEPQIKRQLWKFQEILSQIPEWNMDKVQRETARLIQQIQCDYLEELLTAVFIAHTKVLTAIRIGNKNKRVQITVPKLDHFIHRALSESSRLLWSSAYLFHNELSPIEKQKNHRQIEQLLHEGISQAIRGLLPVKNILKDYLTEPETDADAEDDAEDEEEIHQKPEMMDESTEMEKVDENNIEHKDEIQAEKKVDENVESSTIPVANDTLPTEKIDAETTEALPIEKISVQSNETMTSETSSSLTTTSPPASPPVFPTTPPPTPLLSVVEKQDILSSTPIPITPTLIVETEPSVRFTDFDQVIQQRNGKTHIDYVEQDRNLEELNEEIHFIDDEGEPLSDFEDLTDEPHTALNDDDFDTL